jgi:hypothetical protein
VLSDAAIGAQMLALIISRNHNPALKSGSCIECMDAISYHARRGTGGCGEETMTLVMEVIEKGNHWHQMNAKTENS